MRLNRPNNPPRSVLLIMTWNAAKIGSRAPHIFQYLTLQLLRTVEFLLIAQTPQTLHADAPRRLAFHRPEQKRLDRQVSPAKRRPVADIGHRLPPASIALLRPGDVDTGRRQHLGLRGQVQRRHGLLRANSVPANDVSLQRERPL